MPGLQIPAEVVMHLLNRLYRSLIVLRPYLFRRRHACANSSLPGLLCPSCAGQLCVLHGLPQPSTVSGATDVSCMCALLVRVLPVAKGTQHQTSIGEAPT